MNELTSVVVMEALEENLVPPAVRSLKGEEQCEGQQPFGLQLDYQRSAGQRIAPFLFKLWRKRYLFLF